MRPFTRLSLCFATLLPLLLFGCAGPSPERGVGQDAGPPQTKPFEGGELAFAQQADGRCLLELRGELGPPMLQRLGPLLRQIEELDCRGKQARLALGATHTSSAITAGAMLRNRGYDTQVPGGTVCDSTCMLLLASGRQRSLEDGTAGARLRFTPLPPDADFYRGECETELSSRQTLTVTRYLRAMLPPATATAVFHKMRTASCARMDLLGVAEGRALGLLTGP